MEFLKYSVSYQIDLQQSCVSWYAIVLEIQSAPNQIGSAVDILYGVVFTNLCMLKSPLRVNSCYPPCKDGNSLFTTVPFKALDELV